MQNNIFFYESRGVNFPSKLICGGISVCKSDHFIERLNSGLGTLEYVISGKGTIILNGKQYNAVAGDALFLPSGTDQCCFSDANAPWSRIFFSFTGNMCNLIAEALSLNDKAVFKNCDISKKMYKLMNMQKLPVSSAELQKMSFSVILEIFMDIFEKSPYKSDSSKKKTELTILTDYIDNNLTHNITLNDMARCIFKSKNYVLRLFKDGCNKTPYEYFLDKKMELSKQLLRETELSVRQISEYLNFETPNYFSTRFRRKYGISPSEYRKINRSYLPPSDF